ncbi:hypothetical protein JCM6882_005957 [Rhodosporidiobolus microsporus]
MPSTKLTAPALLAAALAAFYALVLQPRLRFMGVGRAVVPLHNERCFSIPGLEACEDAWVDSSSGLAYLACSSPSARAHWTPAMLHLNASALPAGPSRDKLVLLDLRTREYSEVTLKGLPDEAEGVWVHGMDVFRSASIKDGKDALTLFLISHRPPADRTRSDLVGASSVIELFSTRLGSTEARWVKTVEHPLVKTPNSVAAVGERAFYVTNDHRDKVHWKRKWEKFYPAIAPSSIVYCDASSSSTPDCSVAADGLVYPNGPSSFPSSFFSFFFPAVINVFQRSSSLPSDPSLKPIRTASVGRPLDNLHLDPPTGSVYATALAQSRDFVAAAADGGVGGRRAAVEVWRLGEGPDAQPELVFADTGEVVSVSTSAVPFRLGKSEKLQLLLTGLFSKEVVVCEIE